MKISSKIMLIGLLSLPALGWFVWTSQLATKKPEKSALAAEQSHNFLKSMDRVAQATARMKSGMQQFVFTGDPGAAAYTERESSLMLRHLETVRQLNSDNITQQKNITRLSQLTQENAVRQLDLIKACLDSPGRSVSITAKQELRTGMDSITVLITAVTKKEQQLLVTRLDAERAAGPRYLPKLAIVYITALALVSLTVYTRYKKSTDSQSDVAEGTSGPAGDEGPCTVMVTTDISGQFTFISNQIKCLTGYNAKELMNKDVCFLVTPPFTKLVSDHFKRQHLAKRPESKIYFPIFTKTGEQKWIEQLSVLKHEEGKITGFQCIIKAISTEKDEAEVPYKPSEKRRRYIASDTSGKEQWGVSKGNWNLP